MKQILKCQVCDNYTLKAEHCGKATIASHPQKYSPQDKYAKYRRQAKEGERKREGKI